MPNSSRYMLVGGMVKHHFTCTNFKPKILPENASAKRFTTAPTYFVRDRVQTVLARIKDAQILTRTSAVLVHRPPAIPEIYHDCLLRPDEHP